MPWRDGSRQQGWLMPPALEELVDEDHPARVVAGFVDTLTPDHWSQMGISLLPRRTGTPAYHPRPLLAVWLYGFMVGVRSSRGLEAACREQLPFIWLAGGLTPDHNTLWRFYQEHREGMRRLLRLTVQVAAELDLIDWSLQAVDGTKIQGDASNRWTMSGEQLERLEQRTTKIIEEIEQNRQLGNAAAPLWSDDLESARKLRTKARGAMDELKRSGQRFVSLVDADARLMRRTGGGTLTGYNAQAVAVRAGEGDDAGALMLLAAEVTQNQVDSGELPGMIDAARESGDAKMTVADAGYFTGESLTAMRDRGMEIAMPEIRQFKDHAFHWRHFRYDAVRDEYTCPEGEQLVFRQVKYTRQTPAKLYGAEPSVCRACRAFGDCTTSEYHGRTITVSKEALALEQHRSWMRSRRAEDAMRKRPALVEPVFAVIKERQAGRRFLLRGFEGVRAEWSLLAIAFNLRALSKHWKRLLGLLGSGLATASAVP